MPSYPSPIGSRSITSGIALASGDNVSANANGVELSLGAPAQKQKTRYTDKTVIAFLNRPTPAKEVGSYNFAGFTLAYRWLFSALAIDGTTPITDAIEAMVAADMGGGYIWLFLSQPQTASPTHCQAYKGTFAQDPVLDYLQDGSGMVAMTAQFVEIG